MAQQDFTVADVLAWARTKPADEAYNFLNSGECAIAQFGRATCRPHLVGLLSSELRAFGLLEAVNPTWGESTFGALVTRLEALSPETPITQSNWAAIDAYLSEIETVSA